MKTFSEYLTEAKDTSDISADDALILRDIFEQSHISKGKNKGKTKGTFSYDRCMVYNAKGKKSLKKLVDTGYIIWKENTIYGTGYQLTQKGLDFVK